MIEDIKSNAALVINQLQKNTDFDFGYNDQSVEWVSEFIEGQRSREQFSMEQANGLTNTLGSFLGECIISVYGGSWVQTEYGWSVEFSNGNSVFPFGKVRKQFENGMEDSILSLFECIGPVFGISRNA